MGSFRPGLLFAISNHLRINSSIKKVEKTYYELELPYIMSFQPEYGFCNPEEL